MFTNELDSVRVGIAGEKKKISPGGGTDRHAECSEESLEEHSHGENKSMRSFR